MTRVAFVIKMLRMQGIEVGCTTAPLKLKDAATIPPAPSLVKCDPALRPPRQDPLGKQVDPRPPNSTTYDDSAWTHGPNDHTPPSSPPPTSPS